MKHLPDKTMLYVTTVSPRVKFSQGSASCGFAMSPMTKVNICFIYTEHCPLFSRNNNMQNSSGVSGDIALEKEYSELHAFMGVEGTDRLLFGTGMILV